MGVVFPEANEADIEKVFNFYDHNHTGRVDYRELSRVIEARVNGEKFESQPKVENQSNEDELQHMMAIFRDRIKARGARGMIGLQRMFKILDDDGSKSLSLYEFTKACNDFRIGISDEYMPTLFNAFDQNRDGTLNFDEFLYAVRGPMNSFRVKLVEKAFHILDKDGSGTVNLKDIKGIYSADRHPDVLSGKRTKN